MDTRISISNRLKELRNTNKYSQAFLAENLFISQAAYSLMESSKNSITSEHIVRLSKLYDVTADFLLTGNTKLINMTPENGFLPLIDAKAHAGYLKNAHKEDVMADFEYYRIPGYKPTKDSVLIEIEGESMQPTIMPGDVLICQTQTNLEYVLDGSIVVLVTEGELLTTRLFKHEDNNYFKMESDNPDNESKKEIRKSKILQLLLILGKVSTVLVPHRELAFKGKIKTLEESVESLNKEVYKISKMLQNKSSKSKSK